MKRQEFNLCKIVTLIASNQIEFLNVLKNHHNIHPILVGGS